ncbi:MAG: molybdopterin-synthase adenylyltransferase MoeB [Candidatus Latescibacteria bacterium]|jgi:adenylyltransferase/sulfurtransferase|nr:molybdopterin-synthase adenylyltransferase MoeB [Candidatus Latescibacterota bacterium]
MSHPVDQTITFSKEEIQRYGRHLVLPDIAMEGQKRLKGASVLLIGTGGLGSPAAIYLAAAGVGKLGLVDFDVVDHSNLQRQIIFKTDSIGEAKVDSARESLAQLNPNVEVATHEVALTSRNAMEICSDYDLILDGTDNFQTRYLANDVCVLLNKPYVYGSVMGLEGQASVFWARRGPCYRCLYPVPPPPDLVPSCAEGGVLGVLPGIIGLVQATESIKLILDKGESLIGRLMIFDAMGMRFLEVGLRKDENCPMCGRNPSIHELIDYDQFCGVSASVEEDLTPDEIPLGAQEFSEQVKQSQVFLLDVREPHEWDICHLEGATLIPSGELADRLSEVDGSKPILVYCRDGTRSLEAIRLLYHSGYTSVRHLKGGILAWIDEIDPSLPKY